MLPLNKLPLNKLYTRYDLYVGDLHILRLAAMHETGATDHVIMVNCAHECCICSRSRDDCYVVIYTIYGTRVMHTYCLECTGIIQIGVPLPNSWTLALSPNKIGVLTYEHSMNDYLRALVQHTYYHATVCETHRMCKCCGSVYMDTDKCCKCDNLHRSLLYGCVISSTYNLHDLRFAVCSLVTMITFM